MQRITIIIMLMLLSLSFASTSAQNFHFEKISERIFLIVDPQGGEGQLVVKSEKGLVVFNTFWSQITAQRYKNEISKALNRNDFAYTINLVDRLDMFGGNAAYPETKIIGHDSFLEKYQGKEKEVAAEIKNLIDIWRWKEDISRKRLETQEKGSEKAITEERWMNTCKQRADELKEGFSLVLPTAVYHDRMNLELGDLTLKLIWFGKAGFYNGMTLVVIPEEKLAIIPGFIMHPQHLAPHPHNEYADLDVPHWISVLEEILEGEKAVENIICGMGDFWSTERAQTHLEYIRKLWNRVKLLEAEGKTLAQVQEQLSLEQEFAFVKEMQVYQERGDTWLRPQHLTHVRLFYLQHKNLASEMIKKEGVAALPRIRKLRDSGGDLYFEEASLNGLGYLWLNTGKLADALEIFKFNVEQFPASANVYDSLGEAYMKSGEPENAIKNYQRSLELNPENTNAKKMLEQLQPK
jgi:tetratricopeptide (TPR) repeat protein